MTDFWKAIATWFDRTRMELNLLKIEDHYRQAGHPCPPVAAREELFIRAEIIERFRDEASDAFLKGTDLASFKESWIKENLSAKRTILDSATTGKVRAIIRSMPDDEALHGPALAKHKIEFNQWLAEMKELNRRNNGPAGLSERAQRVLRGRV